MTAPLQIGPYRMLLELASGGMGTVFVARHGAAAGFERLVVVKRVHQHLLKSPEFVDMFRDEARLASLIRHPNVVSVDDVVDDAGELLLVQPYVESLTLAELAAVARKQKQKIPPAIVSRILGDALAGLDGAHAAKDLRGVPLDLVHRDVSPQNVLVGTDGRSRIIDFGIAKAARRITVTNSGVLKGKLSYMPPEQFRHQELDKRADVFASGVMLYEALVGKRPFDGADEADTLLSILVDDPAPPSTLTDGVPAEVDEVVRRALARERDERYASAGELHDALEKALPPAPAREVAALVERLGASRLEKRRSAIAEALDEVARGATPIDEIAAPPETVRAKPVARAGSISDAQASSPGAIGTDVAASMSTDAGASLPTTGTRKRMSRRRVAVIALGSILGASALIGALALRGASAPVETMPPRTALTGSLEPSAAEPPAPRPAAQPETASAPTVAPIAPAPPVSASAKPQPKAKAIPHPAPTQHPEAHPKTELQKSPYGSP